MGVAYISNYMDKRVKSKLLALLGYSAGIIFIQQFLISKLDDWWRILFGVFFIMVTLFQALKLLDIEIRIPISRRWYYILLTAMSVGFLILFIKLLWF